MEEDTSSLLTSTFSNLDETFSSAPAFYGRPISMLDFQFLFHKLPFVLQKADSSSKHRMFGVNLQALRSPGSG